MVVSRPWRDEQDYERLRQLLQSLPDMAEEAGALTIGDLDWWRYTHNNPDKMRDVQLWLGDDDNTVLGFVWPEGSTFDSFIDARHSQLLPEMIAWGEDSARGQGVKQIEVFANDRDEPLRALLKQAGYEPDEFHFVFRGQSITGELETATLPEGFSFSDMSTLKANAVQGLTERELEVLGLIKSGLSNAQIADASTISRHTVARRFENILQKVTALEQDIIERRVELHRAVWAPSKMTVAKHKAVMASPTYRPDLDLIVVAPNGDFVSYTIIWFDPVNWIGVFEPVGCHPDYRQRGLTRALMLEGLVRLKALGARKAFVNSLHSSLPANRLYESSGFRLVDRQRKWVKSLE